MPTPRKQLVNISSTPYYHCTSRCVRRAYLCGYDKKSKVDYQYRQQWIENRIRLLSSIFAIDVLAYAVMSNHYHIVVKLDPDQSDEWTERELMQRWSCLYNGTVLFQRYRDGESLTFIEIETVRATLNTYKRRLTDLSWFMKCLNEYIARQANREDECHGHFWEARFTSQALTSEAVLITCMIYVDLNPIRARKATTPEQSAHTSIKERLTHRFDFDKAIKSQQKIDALMHFPLPLKPLLPFADEIDGLTEVCIPISFSDYVELVDWTGRATRSDKRGVVPSTLSPIFERLRLPLDTWLQNASQFEARFRQRLVA